MNNEMAVTDYVFARKWTLKCTIRHFEMCIFQPSYVNLTWVVYYCTTLGTIKTRACTTEWMLNLKYIRAKDRA